jgi:hypothetical protein
MTAEDPAIKLMIAKMEYFSFGLLMAGYLQPPSKMKITAHLALIQLIF